MIGVVSSQFQWKLIPPSVSQFSFLAFIGLLEYDQDHNESERFSEFPKK